MQEENRKARREKKKQEKLDAKAAAQAEKEQIKQEKLDAKAAAQAEKEKNKQDRQKEKDTAKAEKQALKERRRAAKAAGEPLPKEDWSKGKKILVGILASIFGAAALFYLGGVAFFAFHFGFGSTVNDVNVSFKNVSQVEQIISGQVDSYELTLVERNDVTEIVKGSDVDLKYIADGQVKQLLKKQNPWKWPYRFYKRDSFTGIQSHASVELNEEKLATVMNQLSCMDESKMIAPVDAYPELSGSQYVVHPEDPGTTINKEVFASELKEALLSTQPSLDLSEESCYVEPKYYSDSQELLDIVAKYNKYLSLTITYHFGDTTEVLDGAITSTWLTWDEQFNPTINQEALAGWVADLANRHNTVGATRTFTTATGGTAEVSGGTYGWAIDQEQEITLINQMFTDLQSQDREPVWAQTGAVYDMNNDFGNTFIEVNISSQHVWYVQEGSIVFESDVVTGLPTAARSTPTGVFSVLEMMQNKTLRGDRRPDGTYEYETPVAYWIRVTWTGVGFHDATWQPSFGGNRYTYAGSHGCINMPYSAVQQMYSMVYVGCPIIIHY